jgi:phage terminase large subunit-like protein
MPPAGDWRTWLFLGGRGSGKSRAGAELVRHWVETRQAKHIALVGVTSADVRDTMILGESGLLSIASPWCTPRYEGSRRRVIWPNGIVALCFSSEEPDRLRGGNFSHAWCDEAAHWKYAAMNWNMLSLALRVGSDPRVCVTTTPKTTTLMKDLLSAPTTATSHSTSYENRRRLAPQFFDSIIKRFEGTSLGESELLGKMVEHSEAQWFVRFNRAKHVSEQAELNPWLPAYLAIDCGVSRWTGAILYQFVPIDRERCRMCIVADYLAENRLHDENAAALLSLVAEHLAGNSVLDAVLLDPAASARTGAGPTAEAEYQRVFGRRVRRWPLRGVLDSLSLVESLLGGDQ